MKNLLKNITLALCLAALIVGASVAFAAVITPKFPGGANNFAEGDVIENEDWNALESEIGVRVGNVATGSPDSLNFVVRNGAFSTTSIMIGTTASTSISATATSTFQKGISATSLNITSTSASSTYSNGIVLTGGCIQMGFGGSCLGTASTIIAGSDTQVQFNDGGAFGGDSGLVFNKTADRLTMMYSSSTALTVSGAGYFGTASTTNLTVSSLTSGRVPYASTGGLLIDSSNLTYDGTLLNVGTNVSLSGSGTTTISNLAVNSLQVGVTGFSYVNLLAPSFTATSSIASIFPYASSTALSATNINATNFIGALTGNASTATALASDPSDCGANAWAISIAITGGLTCSAISYLGITAMTSANFFGLITDETGGSGVVVGSVSPTLTGLTTMTYASTTMLTSSAGATFATASGNMVGIGTTSPYSTLSVQGNLAVSGTSVSGSFLATSTILATSTSMTINWSNFSTVRIGTAATTIAFTNVTPASAMTLEVCNPRTTASTVVFSGVLWAGGTAPTHTTTADKCDLMVFRGGNGTSTPIVYGGVNANY